MWYNVIAETYKHKGVFILAPRNYITFCCEQNAPCQDRYRPCRMFQQLRQPDEERFAMTNYKKDLFERVTKLETGCWIWIGAKGKGYGQIRINKKTVEAHRVAWEKINGKILDGLWVLHKCDVRGCINPDHLFLGTAKDNSQDMTKKGRANNQFMQRKCCKRGHEYNSKNTRYTKKGYRRCRICDKLEMREYRKRKGVKPRASTVQEAIAIVTGKE